MNYWGDWDRWLIKKHRLYGYWTITAARSTDVVARFATFEDARRRFAEGGRL